MWLQDPATHCVHCQRIHSAAAAGKMSKARRRAKSSLKQLTCKEEVGAEAGQWAASIVAAEADIRLRLENQSKELAAERREKVSQLVGAALWMWTGLG